MKGHRVFMVSLFALCFAAMGLGQNSGPGSGAAKGTWKLNVDKSQYGQQPKPKSMSLVVTADSDASVKWRVSGIDDKGKPVHESYSGAIDSKPHPLTGDPQIKTIAYTRDGEDVKGALVMKDGSTGQETVSMPDHDTITVKTEGQSGGVTEVWERVHRKAAAAKKPAS